MSLASLAMTNAFLVLMLAARESQAEAPCSPTHSIALAVEIEPPTRPSPEASSDMSLPAARPRVAAPLPTARNTRSGAGWPGQGAVRENSQVSVGPRSRRCSLATQ